MNDKEIIRELKVARDLLSRRPMTNDLVEDFVDRLDARMDFLIDSKERLEKMQFQETGIGGRAEDIGITENIERIDNNLAIIDSMIYFIKKQARKFK